MNDPFLNWCSTHLEACEARRKALLADQRGDEARFEQVRSNVYGIFRTAYGALGHSRAHLLQRLSEISAPWEESLRQAVRTRLYSIAEADAELAEDIVVNDGVHYSPMQFLQHFLFIGKLLWIYHIVRVHKIPPMLLSDYIFT